jgi:hypothetical protein
VHQRQLKSLYCHIQTETLPNFGIGALVADRKWADDEAGACILSNFRRCCPFLRVVNLQSLAAAPHTLNAD